MKTKKLGLGSIILLGVNSIIGYSIFLLPSLIYNKVGLHSLWMTFLVGGLSLFIALCFGEMASKYSRSGAVYIYTKENFGDFWGFIVGFMKYLTAVVAWATMARAFSSMIAVPFPMLDKPILQSMIAVVLVLFYTGINLLGVQTSKIFNNIITILKTLPIVFFILIGGFYIDFSHLSHFSSEHLNAISLTSGFLLLFNAFSGFENIAVASQDMENPRKNIPKAILFVMLIIVCFYFAVFAISSGVLGENLNHSKNAIAVIMGVILGPVGESFVMIAAIISILGINFAAAFGSPRNLFPMAEDGFIPKSLGVINKRGVPQNATLLTGLLVILIAFNGQFVYLAQLTVVGRFVQYLAVMLALLKSRKKGVEGTFAVPFAPFIVTISILIIGAITLTAYAKTFPGILAILVGVLIYVFYSKPHREKNS